jgi:hypothetical protein
MRSESGCPIPPAAPRTTTLRSGADSDEKVRRIRVDDGDGLVRVDRIDFNMAVLIFLERVLRVLVREI